MSVEGATRGTPAVASNEPTWARVVAVFFGDLISYSFVSVGWRVVEQVRGVRSDGHRFFLREERSVRRSGGQVWACIRTGSGGRQTVTTTFPRVWPARRSGGRRLLRREVGAVR